MNAKNKIYGTRNSQCTVSSDEVQVIEKIYNHDNDKSSSDRERSGSYDLSCCTENSLYESKRIYSKARNANNSKVSNLKIKRNYAICNN